MDRNTHLRQGIGVDEVLDGECATEQPRRGRALARAVWPSKHDDVWKSRHKHLRAHACCRSRMYWLELIPSSAFLQADASTTVDKSTTFTG